MVMITTANDVETYRRMIEYNRMIEKEGYRHGDGGQDTPHDHALHKHPAGAHRDLDTKEQFGEQ